MDDNQLSRQALMIGTTPTTNYSNSTKPSLLGENKSNTLKSKYAFTFVPTN